MTDNVKPPSRASVAEALNDILRLSEKALPGPWSSKVLQDWNLYPHDKDTPYVYGPNGAKALMGLWPIHGPKPEDTEEAERQTFATVELVAALRNFVVQHGAALRAALTLSENTFIPYAEIEAQIEDIAKNGMALKRFGGENVDEGRCRELCAMYLREFISTHRMGIRLAEIEREQLGDPEKKTGIYAKPAERERGS